MNQIPPPLPDEYEPETKEMGDDLGMRILLPVGRSGWAIAAGYLGLFSLLILPAPFALTCGIIGIRHIQISKNQKHPKHGMGRAIFGVIMGALGTAVLIVLIVAYLLDQ